MEHQQFKISKEKQKNFLIKNFQKSSLLQKLHRSDPFFGHKINFILNIWKLSILWQKQYSS